MSHPAARTTYAYDGIPRFYVDATNALRLRSSGGFPTGVDRPSFEHASRAAIVQKSQITIVTLSGVVIVREAEVFVWHLMDCFGVIPRRK